MTPERDSASQKTLAVLIPAQTAAADTTPASVDCRGYRKALLILAIGAGGITFSGTNKIEFVLTHSDDDSTYSNVTDADIVPDPTYSPTTVTSGIVRALTAAHASGTVQKIGYIGGKRYLKLLADFSGTHGTGTPFSATLALSGANYEGSV